MTFCQQSLSMVLKRLLYWGLFSTMDSHHGKLAEWANMSGQAFLSALFTSPASLTEEVRIQVKIVNLESELNGRMFLAQHFYLHSSLLLPDHLTSFFVKQTTQCLNVGGILSNNYSLSKLPSESFKNKPHKSKLRAIIFSPCSRAAIALICAFISRGSVKKAN